MEFRFRLLLVTLLVLVIVAVWTFPRWWPLLNQEAVLVAFEGLPEDKQAEFMVLPPDERNMLLAMREENPELALLMAEARLGERITAPEEEFLFDAAAINASLIRRGSFVRIDALHWAEGDVQIYQSPDLTRVLRFENFRSALAPDMRVVLSSDPSPLLGAEVGIDYIDLGALRATDGSHNYSVPSTVDLSRYQSVVIYSPRYNIVVSSAALR